VPYQTEALGESLERIRRFVADFPQLQGRTNDVVLTCEEIMKNIIENAHGSILKRDFDVHLRCTDTQITFVVKDAGLAFNPLEHLPQSPLDPEAPQFGIRLISSTCEELSYKYMWGQNMMLGTFRV
jgi:anti-sigma regulatory factor (Ser/Thr protein kinase)